MESISAALNKIVVRVISVQKKTYFSILLIGYVAAVVFYSTMFLIPDSRAIFGVSFFEAVKLAFYLIFIVHVADKVKKTRLLAWKLIMIAALLWIPGQLVMIIHPITSGNPHISPNLADYFILMAIPTVVVGILMLGFYGLPKREKIQLLVHSITFGACVAFVGVVYISLFVAPNKESLFENHLIDFATFTFDIIIISVGIALILYRQIDKSIFYIMLGLFSNATADILYVAGRFQDESVGRPIQRILIFTALLFWVHGTTTADGIPKHQPNHKSEIKLAVVAYIMIAAILGIAFTTVSRVEEVPSVVLYSFLMVFAAILVTQIVGFFDNKKLVESQHNSIIEISKSEEKYQELATHDTLTDLVNRSYFIESLESELDQIDEDDSLAVMFIDLDRFKELNDTFGHESGDLVIKTIAHRISGVVGDQGLVCRLGGDEFAILVSPPAQRDVTFDLAMRVLDEVIKPIDVFGNEMYLTCSIGIAMSDTEANAEPQELLRNADAAMYRAKELGRNRIEYASESLKPARDISIWSLSDLHKAIARSEIETFFQPIIDLETNKTVAFEALARWNHHEHGYISPDEFIPVAEDNGLIIDLGDAIIRESLKQLSNWDRTHGVNSMSININISQRQLSHPRFMLDIMSYCAKYQIAPSRIIFEMTESALLGDARGVMSLLNELKSHGFAVVIDDFGTGYSSLSYLKKFPIAGFKIDGSFIRGYGHDENDTAIVNALIALGKSMGLVVTAEGVQSSEIRDTLRDLGCTQAQGYLYSQAIKASDVPLSMIKGSTLKSVESA